MSVVPPGFANVFLRGKVMEHAVINNSIEDGGFESFAGLKYFFRSYNEASQGQGVLLAEAWIAIWDHPQSNLP